MKVVRKLALILCLLCVSSSAFAAKKVLRSTVISVRDQQAFDRMTASIESAVTDGFKDISVEISAGVYYFRENHVDLRAKRWDDVSIVLRGRGAVIVGAGYDGPSPSFRPDVCYLDGKLNRRTFRTRMHQSRRAVSVKNASKGTCILYAAEPDLDIPDCEGVMVQITEWFLSRTYPVSRIRGGKIYFTEPSLFRYGIYYNVNADLYFGHQNPRYRLLNLPSMRKDPVHACEAARFLYLCGCHLRSFEIDGLVFKGNAGHESLLDYYYSQAETFEVRNCTFESIMNYAVYLSDTDNMTFEGNTARNCALGVINADIHSKHARILNNRFEGNGNGLMNTCNIVCWGEDFLVADNVLSDFTYAAIGIGRHYTEERDHLVTGVVERNEIYMSDTFRSSAPMNGLMDSGAIYTWTQNDDVVIRNNLIYDINGPYANRGIFCDDGTNGVRILDNTVLRIANSYAIDLRRASFVETEDRSKVKMTNINNEMDGNRVDGPVRFERRGGDDGCRVGKNITVGK